MAFPVMAGLVPAIHAYAAPVASATLAQMRGGWVYIMTNRPDGNSTLGNRATLLAVFTSIAKAYARDSPSGMRRHGLAWCEFHEDITTAIQRESTMKHCPRAWKVRLILAMNSEWGDFYLDFKSRAVRVDGRVKPGHDTSTHPRHAIDD